MNLQIRRFGLGKSFDESFYDLFYLVSRAFRHGGRKRKTKIEVFFCNCRGLVAYMHDNIE